MKEVKQSLEEKNGNLARTIGQEEQAETGTMDQNSYLWVYFVSAVLALLAGVLTAYLVTRTIRRKPKSRWEKVKDTLRGAIS